MSLKRLVTMVRSARRVFLCGNGGSAANAIHIANDLISVGIPATALTADVATLTAIANDFGYERVFEKQIQVLGREGDLLIALSGSGESRNVTSAMKSAKGKGMKTVGIVGGYHVSPTTVQRRAHLCFARGKDMQAAEEYQLFVGHSIMREIKRRQSK